MDFLLDSLSSALLLLGSLDRELLRVIAVSLQVSFASTFLSSLLGVPLGFVVALREFTGKRILLTVLNALMALPTVVIALFVYAFLSRRGVLGMLDLLYTQTAMVIGQVLLLLPMIVALTIAAVSQVDDRFRKTAMTLGATAFQTARVVFRESRYGILAVLILAFGRVIAEIGISMMLGGNIRGYTRTMTTAMALEYDKGEFVLAVALGIVLVILSLFINILFHLIQGEARRRAL